MSETIYIAITASHGERLDKALAKELPEEVTLSRSRLKDVIQSGGVSLEGGGVIYSPKYQVSLGEVYHITLPDIEKYEVCAENIPLDIVYEDEHLLVINKPVGMVVHPAKGIWTGTLVNAVLYHCRSSLSGIGGIERPGIVHRIDKDTSGLLVVAKSDPAHIELSEQFREHSIHRRYQAFCFGELNIGNPKLRAISGLHFMGGQIKVDRPIARHPHDRLRMAIREGGKHAVTYIENLGSDDSSSISMVECSLETGRTHQIRVHMAHLGHPLLGDVIYGANAKQLKNHVNRELADGIAQLKGQALHARELGFIHPITKEKCFFQVELPEPLKMISQFIA